MAVNDERLEAAEELALQAEVVLEYLAKLMNEHGIYLMEFPEAHCLRSFAQSLLDWQAVNKK